MAAVKNSTPLFDVSSFSARTIAATISMSNILSRKSSTKYKYDFAKNLPPKWYTVSYGGNKETDAIFPDIATAIM